jgi:Ca2+-binding RTX toxin-like protein
MAGGAGDDTVIVGLNFSHYAVAYAGGVATLTHNGNAVALRNVEYVMFADGPARPLAEVLHNIATDGNEVLTGTAGDDLVNGGIGADTLAGGAGNDVYAVNSDDDVVTEFADEGRDLVNVGFAAAGTYALADNVEDAAVVSTAKVIGSAGANYEVGDTALFAVSTATATVVYRFQSGDDNAVVSAGELTQLAIMTDQSVV